MSKDNLAKIIAASPRKTAQLLYDQGLVPSLTVAQFVELAINEAILEEREACAKVAEVEADKCSKARVAKGDLERNYFGGGLRASEEIAKAIRERGKPCG